MAIQAEDRLDCHAALAMTGPDGAALATRLPHRHREARSAVAIQPEVRLDCRAAHAMTGRMVMPRTGNPTHPTVIAKHIVFLAH